MPTKRLLGLFMMQTYVGEEHGVCNIDHNRATEPKLMQPKVPKNGLNERNSRTIFLIEPKQVL